MISDFHHSEVVAVLIEFSCWLLLQCFVRPPCVVVGDLRFHPGYLFFIHQLPSELTGRNSAIMCYMLGSKPDLKMHVENLGRLLPQKSAAYKTLICECFFDDFKIAKSYLYTVSKSYYLRLLRHHS